MTALREGIWDEHSGNSRQEADFRGRAHCLFVSVLVFVGTEILPGDVAHAILGQGATPELVAQIKERLGLDEPLHGPLLGLAGQFRDRQFRHLAGEWCRHRTEIGRRASNTIILALCTTVIAVPLSIILGLAAAVKPGGLVDRVITSSSLALISFPDFLVAVVLVTIFAVKLRWLPAIASIRPSYELVDWIRILILPVMGLTFTILAHMVRMTRSAVLNVLSSPAIEMAILKGVPRRRLLLRHALPNALGPIINVVALNLAYLISGVVVIETLFNFPGPGSLHGRGGDQPRRAHRADLRDDLLFGLHPPEHDRRHPVDHRQPAREVQEMTPGTRTWQGELREAVSDLTPGVTLAVLLFPDLRLPRRCLRPVDRALWGRRDPDQRKLRAAKRRSCGWAATIWAGTCCRG